MSISATAYSGFTGSETQTSSQVFTSFTHQREDGTSQKYCAGIIENPTITWTVKVFGNFVHQKDTCPFWNRKLDCTLVISDKELVVYKIGEKNEMEEAARCSVYNAQELKPKTEEKPNVLRTIETVEVVQNKARIALENEKRKTVSHFDFDFGTGSLKSDIVFEPRAVFSVTKADDQISEYVATLMDDPQKVWKVYSNWGGYFHINNPILSIFDHRQPHLPPVAQIALFDSRAPRYDSGDYWVRQHSSQGKIYINVGSEKHNTSKVFSFDPKTAKLEKLLKEDLINAVFFKTRLIECGKQSDPLAFPLSIKIYDLETKKLIKEYSDYRGQWSISLD